MAQFDYVSDLHIDYWDPKWRTLYMNNGAVSNYPLEWNRMSIKSDILVVAGDVSDKLEYTIEYLKMLKNYYKKILFVDGNHEHTYMYPKLYKRDYIANKFKGLDGIHYLPKQDVIIGDTAFIGLCCWWDYGCKDNMEECRNMIKDKPLDDSMLYAKNVVVRANNEAQKLMKKIEKYQNNKSVNDIVLVTHTVPFPKYARRIKTEYNHFLRNLTPYFMDKKSKIKRWVFGHNHDEWFDKKYGIRLMCHPRGRPEDHNRKSYDVRTSRL